MIKTILATAIMATVFTGCVGTLVANNNVKKTPSSSVHNAKCKVQQENNSSIIKKDTIKKKVR